MLERMRRPYTRDQYLQLIEKEGIIPGLSLSTDIIAGFCGETERTSADLITYARSRVRSSLHVCILRA